MDRASISKSFDKQSMKINFDSQWRSIINNVRASSRRLMELSTAPAMGTTKLISYMAGILGAITNMIDDIQARISSYPLSTPRDTIDDARRRQRR
nr:hypothetical protein MtrunA17_Chr5g0433251 [Ipomoea batatas]GMD14626.1 hypothetical protein MtrunA17_Chr5g0433251 [Ipomoea batatas]GMD17697.1 hypothetical protein MtrunA17_Chr5g0433251 [Ipomoea batatas]